MLATAVCAATETLQQVKGRLSLGSVSRQCEVPRGSSMESQSSHPLPQRRGACLHTCRPVRTQGMTHEDSSEG